MPAWPMRPPAHGSVVLRGFADRDVPLVMELATDPYIPLIGNLPAAAAEEALEWIRRQRGRLAEGIGLSFAVADAEPDRSAVAGATWRSTHKHGPSGSERPGVLRSVGGRHHGADQRPVPLRFRQALPDSRSGRGQSSLRSRSRFSRVIGGRPTVSSSPGPNRDDFTAHHSNAAGLPPSL
jgi:hypothetical protein